MADYEKVIKGLEYCVLSNDCRPCEYMMEFDDTGCQIMKDALVLLKEQPKKVRCKDCKYYDHFNGCMSWHDVNSNNDNWYCADGERRGTDD